MIRTVFILMRLCILFACSKEDDKLNRNAYLTNTVVSMDRNLYWPEYNSLKFPGSLVVVPQGIKGIVVYCVSETQYWAFDLTDPNHAPNNCSRMEIEGVVARCPCPDDSNEYDIVNFG